MPHKLEEECEKLTDEINQWIESKSEKLTEYEQHPVEGMSDRAAEISWPLLAIGNELGIEDELAEAIIHMIDEYHELTDETDRMLELIHGIAEAFETVGRDRIHTEELLPMLTMTGRSAEMDLSAYLNKYEIGPYRLRIRRDGTSKNRNGYSLDQFEELFGMHNIEVNLNGS